MTETTEFTELPFYSQGAISTRSPLIPSVDNSVGPKMEMPKCGAESYIETPCLGLDTVAL